MCQASLLVALLHPLSMKLIELGAMRSSCFDLEVRTAHFSGSGCAPLELTLWENGPTVLCKNGLQALYAAGYAVGYAARPKASMQWVLDGNKICTEIPGGQVKPEMVRDWPFYGAICTSKSLEGKNHVAVEAASGETSAGLREQTLDHGASTSQVPNTRSSTDLCTGSQIPISGEESQKLPMGPVDVDRMTQTEKKYMMRAASKFSGSWGLNTTKNRDRPGARKSTMYVLGCGKVLSALGDSPDLTLVAAALACLNDVRSNYFNFCRAWSQGITQTPVSH